MSSRLRMTQSNAWLGRIPRWARLTALALVLLGLLRVVLNPCLTWAINYSLRELPDLRGGVEAVRLSFVPGYLEVDGVAFDLFINDPNGHTRVKRQLLRIKALRTEWSYAALVRGVVAAELFVDTPSVSFWRIASQQQSAPKAKQAAEEGAEVIAQWREPLSRLIPVRLDKVDVVHGSVHFVDSYASPRIELEAHDLAIHLANITNRRGLQDAMYATADVAAVLPGQGAFHLDMKMDPMANTPTFALHTEVKHLNLVALNALLQAYANFDLTSGGIDIYAEIAARGGEFEGYAKPLVRDMDVRVWRQEGGNNPLALAWRASLSAVSSLFRNNDAHRVALRLPIEGKFKKPDVELWQAVVSLLRNAFMEALLPHLDNSTSMQHMPKQKQIR